MAEAIPLADLLDRAGKVFGLAHSLARDFEEEFQSGSTALQLSGESVRVQHKAKINDFMAAVLELRESIQNPPEGFEAVAEQLRKAGKYARDFPKLGDLDILDLWPDLNTLAHDGREATKAANKSNQSDKPFAFLEESTKKPTLSLLDKYPQTTLGHLAFLEFVRDEIHYAASAKQQMVAKGYTNETLSNQVDGIKWAEAGLRGELLVDLPKDVVRPVKQVLARDLTVGTVEQIDELLTSAAQGLRDAWEERDLMQAGADIPETDCESANQGQSSKQAIVTDLESIKKEVQRPPEKALMAWRLRDLTGITSQTEIAKKLTEQGFPATQGEVSRWLKKVEEYLVAGNVLPNPPGPLASQPTSIDPAVLDRGKRQDSRTRRQRERRNPDSEDT